MQSLRTRRRGLTLPRAAGIAIIAAGIYLGGAAPVSAADSAMTTASVVGSPLQLLVVAVSSMAAILLVMTRVARHR